MPKSPRIGVTASQLAEWGKERFTPLKRKKWGCNAENKWGRKTERGKRGP